MFVQATPGNTTLALGCYHRASNRAISNKPQLTRTNHLTVASRTQDVAIPSYVAYSVNNLGVRDSSLETTILNDAESLVSVAAGEQGDSSFEQTSSAVSKQQRRGKKKNSSAIQLSKAISESHVDGSLEETQLSKLMPRQPSTGRSQARRSRQTNIKRSKSSTPDVVSRCIRYDSTGEPYVDRTGLCSGEVHWFALQVVAGKEKVFAKYLEKEMDDKFPGALFKAWVPEKTVMAYSIRAEKITKQKRVYGQQGWLFIKCELDIPTLEVLTGSFYFQRFRNALPWRFDFMPEDVELILPCEDRFIRHVEEWVVTEENEDLEAVYGPGGGPIVAPSRSLEDNPDLMEVIETVDFAGRVVRKRQLRDEDGYRGSFNNPSRWFSSSSQAPMYLDPDFDPLAPSESQPEDVINETISPNAENEASSSGAVAEVAADAGEADGYGDFGNGGASAWGDATRGWDDRDAGQGSVGERGRGARGGQGSGMRAGGHDEYEAGGGWPNQDNDGVAVAGHHGNGELINTDHLWGFVNDVPPRGRRSQGHKYTRQPTLQGAGAAGFSPQGLPGRGRSSDAVSSQAQAQTQAAANPAKVLLGEAFAGWGLPDLPKPAPKKPLVKGQAANKAVWPAQGYEPTGQGTPNPSFPPAYPPAGGLPQTLPSDSLWRPGYEPPNTPPQSRRQSSTYDSHRTRNAFNDFPPDYPPKFDDYPPAPRAQAAGPRRDVFGTDPTYDSNSRIQSSDYAADFPHPGGPRGPRETDFSTDLQDTVDNPLTDFPSSSFRSDLGQSREQIHLERGQEIGGAQRAKRASGPPNITPVKARQTDVASATGPHVHGRGNASWGADLKQSLLDALDSDPLGHPPPFRQAAVGPLGEAGLDEPAGTGMGKKPASFMSMFDEGDEMPYLTRVTSPQQQAAKPELGRVVAVNFFDDGDEDEDQVGDRSGRGELGGRGNAAPAGYARDAIPKGRSDKVSGRRDAGKGFYDSNLALDGAVGNKGAGASYPRNTGMAAYPGGSNEDSLFMERADGREDYASNNTRRTYKKHGDEDAYGGNVSARGGARAEAPSYNQSDQEYSAPYGPGGREREMRLERKREREERERAKAEAYAALGREDPYAEDPLLEDYVMRAAGEKRGADSYGLPRQVPDCGIAPGCTIEVTAGDFKGFRGTVQGVQGNTLLAELDIFGQKTRAKVSAASVIVEDGSLQHQD